MWHVNEERVITTHDAGFTQFQHFIHRQKTFSLPLATFVRYKAKTRAVRGFRVYLAQTTAAAGAALPSLTSVC